MDNQKGTRDRCPDEMCITRYALHLCSAAERAKMEIHLSECLHCLREVALLTKARPEIQNETGWEQLPASMYDREMKRVRKMTQSQTSVLILCLRFCQGQWEMIQHTGTLVRQPAVTMRGQSPAARSCALPTIVKKLNKYQIRVELKENRAKTVDLHLKVQRIREKSPVSDLHFILTDEKEHRVLEDLSRDGVIAFEGLRPGEYSIAVLRGQDAIAEVSIDLSGETGDQDLSGETGAQG